MKSIKYLLLTGMSLIIIGCNKSYNNSFKLDIDSNGCTYLGLKDTYYINEKANIVFDIEKDFYHPLTKSDFTIYGSDDFNFDAETSTLTVKMITNIGVKVTPKPLVGVEKSYYDANLWTLEHSDFDNPHTYNKIKYTWNIDSYGNELTYTKYCLKQLFEEMGIPVGDDVPLSGTQIIEESGTTEPIILDHNNGRIVPTEKDKAFLSENSAVLDLHNAVSLKTKNAQAKGHLIIHLDNAASTTYAKLDLKAGDFNYKYWTLHAPSTIEVTYINE